MSDEPFWRRKSLEEMTPTEWESLCDGCGRCCLLKLEDEDSGQIDFTNVACRLLDQGQCRCKRYENRRTLVEDCVSLTPETVRTLKWLPSTCAYRLVADGQDLAWWHPLISDDPETVHQAGISVRGRVISETQITDEEEYEDHICDWPR